MSTCVAVSALSAAELTVEPSTVKSDAAIVVESRASLNIAVTVVLPLPVVAELRVGAVVSIVTAFVPVAAFPAASVPVTTILKAVESLTAKPAGLLLVAVFQEVPCTNQPRYPSVIGA